MTVRETRRSFRNLSLEAVMVSPGQTPIEVSLDGRSRVRTFRAGSPQPLEKSGVADDRQGPAISMHYRMEPYRHFSPDTSKDTLTLRVLLFGSAASSFL